MELFSPILSQMIFLFAFIVIGYILAKWKFIPEESARVLSKLENIVFIPALVLGTFIGSCTVDAIGTMWRLFLGGFACLALLIPLSFALTKLFFKEAYLKKIATYALAFSNFGYMGNAIVSAVFPDIFSDYLIFCLPFWLLIYIWGIPILIISDASGEKHKWTDGLKNLLNPMLVAALVGIVLGLTGWGLKLPTALLDVINVSGNCMSPIAMLLTGMTLGRLDLWALLKRYKIYIVTGLKLVVYPLIFIGIFLLLPHNAFFSDAFFKCALCVAAMPTGLNPVVVPAGYGKDTSDAAGMALVSSALSVLSIPLAFMLLQAVVL